MSDLVQRVAQSAVDRAAMVKRFGLVPMSILRVPRDGLSGAMHRFQRERLGRGNESQNDMVTEAGRQNWHDKGKLGLRQMDNSQRHPKNRLCLSTMPPELVRFFVRYYAKPGQTYLDPFMGQGIRMQVAHRMGLDYYGYDVSMEFYQYIDAVRKRIDNHTTILRTVLGDSRLPDEVPDGVGDFCFTSPPYWDVEYYGDEAEQLGTGKTYDQFLEGMQQVAAAWLPKFRSGAWCIINVNDIRHRRFYPYHADTMTLFQKAGWFLHDLWILDGIVAGLPKMFAVQRNKLQIAPKVHEYAIVFRAP